MTGVVVADRDDPLIISSPAVRRWERGMLQVLTVSWMYAIYDELRAAATGSWSSAATHARQIVSVERAIGLDIEHTVQQITFHLPWLVTLCNLCYGLTHLVVPPIVLVILDRRGAAHIPPPRAPPRCMPRLIPALLSPFPPSTPARDLGRR